MINIETKRGFCCKSKISVEYNKAKKSIDLSNQMSAYSSPLRKTLKWYKKLAFELCFNTAVINSLFVFQEVTGQKISVTEFRRQLVNGLSQREDEQIPHREGKILHKLQKKKGSVHTVRKYCSGCYAENSRLFRRKKAKNITKKVVTFCYLCKSQPYFCLECFNKAH
ncbi:uncharacterized protein LOC122522750 [Polistes fuscatus]|uniref:uncharacterized protein LOC122522750 n=1 Tax=Polistes fuscatus TaxID=30207 RepID=UPI001CA7F29F|nr:uncharacterized protein LOC122522750 [Polistes fuscatus]